MPTLLSSAEATSGLLTLVSYLLLFLSIRKKATTGNWVTWSVTGLLAGIVLESQLRAGGISQVAIMTAQMIGAAAVFAISVVKKSSKSLLQRRIDCSMFVGAMLAVGVRVSLHSPKDVIIATTIADCIGMIPSICEAADIKEPFVLHPWAIDALAGLCAAVAIGQSSGTLLLFPIYLVMINLTVVATRLTARKVTKKQKPTATMAIEKPTPHP